MYACPLIHLHFGRTLRPDNNLKKAKRREANKRRVFAPKSRQALLIMVSTSQKYFRSQKAKRPATRHQRGGKETHSFSHSLFAGGDDGKGMCVAFLYIGDDHSPYSLVLAVNRDEAFAR